MAREPGSRIQRWRAERARHERAATRAYSHYLRQRRRTLRLTLIGFAAVLLLVIWFWRWHAARVEFRPVWSGAPEVEPGSGSAPAARSGDDADVASEPAVDPGSRPAAGADGATAAPAAAAGLSPMPPRDVPAADEAADLGQIERALPFVRKGRQAEAAGDRRAAIEQYRIALDIWPAATELDAAVGRLHLELDEAAAAIPFLDRALAAAPSDRARYEMLGRALTATGDWTRCQQLYTLAAGLGDDAGSWAEYQLALLALHRKDYARATGHLRRFLAQPLSEFELDARRRLALIAMLEEEWDEAEAQLQTALTLPGAAQDGEVYLAMAACRAARADTPGTLEWLRKGQPLWDPARADWWLEQSFFDGIRSTRAFADWRRGETPPAP